MPKKKQWNWDKAVEGMQVLVENHWNAKNINGVVRKIDKSSKCRMIDGRPVKSIQVASVTILCDDGQEIIAVRDNNQYQVTLK